jgi:serine/threonine protein kinase
MFYFPCFAGQAVLRQLLSALCLFADHRVVHSDIKPVRGRAGEVMATVGLQPQDFGGIFQPYDCIYIYYNIYIL